MRFAGQIESKRAGDPYFKDLAVFYGSSDSRRRELPRAHAMAAEGYKAYVASASNCTAATEQFTVGGKTFFSRIGCVGSRDDGTLDQCL